jgi:DNA-binding transcriptional MerR regulator/quercetin dioxygenase-like cupin family protein
MRPVVLTGEPVQLTETAQLPARAGSLLRLPMSSDSAEGTHRGEDGLARAPRVREAAYSVSVAAQKVGFSPATLRLWERQGLVTPQRSASGYRSFSDEDVGRLRRIAYLRNVEKLNSAAIRQIINLDTGRRRDAERSRTPMGPRLRKLRKDRELTLEQVASSTGLSVSFVSSLERDLTGVSIATLTRLLSFYGTTVAGLLSNSRRKGNGRLTRAGKRASVVQRFSRVTIEQLTSGPAQMDPSIFFVEPGAGSEGAYAHEGEEFVYVMEGTFEVTLGSDERYRLRVGDCLYYPSTIEHQWCNPGPASARLLWVNTPPTF